MTLPPGWAETTLGDIAGINPKHDPATDRAQQISFVPMPALDEKLGRITGQIDRTLDDVWTGFTHFSEGDVIFAKITPCMENGKSAVAHALTNGLACGSTEFFVMRPEEDVSADFIWRTVRQLSFRREAERHMTGAVGQRRVPRPYLEAHPLALPPAAEQRRIVAKLDALTARLTRARAELDRVPVLAAKLRARFLDDAFGLSQARADETPVTSVGEVARLSSGFGFPKHLQGKTAGAYPFAKVSDISLAVRESGGEIDRAANFVDANDLKVLHAKPVPAGSTVFAKIGEALRLNRRAIARTPIVLDNNCMALSPNEQIDPDYLFCFMQTVDLSPLAVATAVPSVRRGDVAALQLPLPHIAAQRLIVEQLNAAFARADRLEAEAARARLLIDRLEAAILARAFRGELVPQDPADEPASVLLDRIRAQRTTVPKPKRVRRASPTASAGA